MNNSQITKSLQLLRDGFMVQFIDEIRSDERITELLHDLASDFVERNIPIVDEELKYDLALMMMETVSFRSY